MKQAVVLAAGEGNRLRPFTVNKPKAMLAVAGKPILQYVIESLAQNGIRDIVLVVGYRREQIFDYMGSGERFNVDINYVNQERQLGTANALMQAKAAVDKEFLVLPGDKLIDAGTISAFVHTEPEAMLVKKIENPIRSLVVTVNEGLVREAMRCERRAISYDREPGICMVNTGIYAFSHKIFSLMEDEQTIPMALNKMLAGGEKLNAMETDGTWLDITYPWDILSLNDIVLRSIEPGMGAITEDNVSIRGPVVLGENTVIKPNSYIEGPVVIGRGCEVGPNACLMPSTSIGDNVAISPFTQIKNSVIGNDVSIGPNSIIHNSVIDKGCIIAGHFSAVSSETEVKIHDIHHMVTIGTMMGEGCRLESHIVAMPGTIVGNYSRIQSLKTLSGKLPDKSMVM
jgi:glucose-1-phosphate thymidylyltransferase